MPSLLNILLSDEAARALCWTLVHSLWQGTLAALIAGATFINEYKAPPTQYSAANILAAALIAKCIRHPGTQIR